MNWGRNTLVKAIERAPVASFSVTPDLAASFAVHRYRMALNMVVGRFRRLSQKKGCFAESFKASSSLLLPLTSRRASPSVEGQLFVASDDSMSGNKVSLPKISEAEPTVDVTLVRIFCRNRVATRRHLCEEV